MAEKQTEFVYHNIQLYKSESLGIGSHGRVYKAKCDGLLCAAKLINSALFDLRDPGTASYLHKFQKECHLLSLARHPNVVQYLATYYDPDTRLPVLLMELCDENLITFLERSPGPLSYHVQLNICLDIALALVYLHSNSVIHGDLSGYKVLVIAGTQAKVSVSINMSKLVYPSMTDLTPCPGNALYMPPEALNEPITYTTKRDVFSFGVIVIQILTRQFPNPTDRFYNARYDKVRSLVPETERRQAHLQLIPDTHSLKPLALQCLKKEMQRPSALQLSERLSELRKAPQYTESIHQVQTRGGNKKNKSETGDEIATLGRQVKELQQQNIDKEQLNKQLQQELHTLTDAKAREVSELQVHSKQLQSTIEAKDRELQELQEQLQVSEQLVAQFQQTEEKLQVSEQLVKQFQHSLQHKDEMISDLQQTISHHEREIQQLKQDIAGSKQTQEQLQASEQQSQQQKDKTINDLQQTISHHEREIQQLKQQDIASTKQTQEQLQASEQLVANLQQRLQEKDKTISDLQQTISHHEREIQQLKQKDIPTLNLFDVKAKLTGIAERWQDIGLALRLRDHDLSAIATEGRPVKDCLTDMLRLWLNKAYDVEKYGDPSWHMLAQAVRHPAGGNNAALAEQIFPQ